MSVEFIGFISNNNSSETIVRSGPVLDRYHIETVAKAHENAGFDRALLAFHSTTPDSLQIGQHVLGVTDRLKVLIAQRPGFTAPTLIARQLAAVDQLYGGRVALHVITGGNATELKQDGNTVDDKDDATPAPTSFSRWFAPNGPARSRSPTTANTIRSRTGSRRSSPIIARAFRSSSAAPPMPRSRSRASMPTPSHCGASPMPRCAR